jgi:hypothetical protein
MTSFQSLVPYCQGERMGQQIGGESQVQQAMTLRKTLLLVLSTLFEKVCSLYLFLTKFPLTLQK